MGAFEERYDLIVKANIQGQLLNRLALPKLSRARQIFVLTSISWGPRQ